MMQMIQDKFNLNWNRWVFTQVWQQNPSTSPGPSYLCLGKSMCLNVQSSSIPLPEDGAFVIFFDSPLQYLIIW